MSYSSRQFLSKYHSLFKNEETCAKTERRLDFIASIWDYDHILRIDINNRQCLCCTKTFQGINSNKALSQVLGKKGMHIKNNYVPM